MNAINDFLRPYLVNSWMAGSIFDGQMGHLFFGAMLVLLAVRLSWNLYRVVPACVALAAVKEFWFDLNFEVPRRRGAVRVSTSPCTAPAWYSASYCSPSDH